MRNKTAIIKANVEPDIKRKLLDKARENNLSITAFLEKIASEPIVFLDRNVKALLGALKVGTH